MAQIIHPYLNDTIINISEKNSIKNAKNWVGGPGQLKEDKNKKSRKYSVDGEKKITTLDKLA